MNMKKKTIVKGILLLGSLSFFIGCETGVSNKHTQTHFQSTSTQTASKTYSKASSPKASEIKKIFSKSGTPGYYIQVGYFKSEKPSSEFVNSMRAEQLPYTLIKKYENGHSRYHALVGPYRSYNQANSMKNSTAKYIASNGFIVKLTRP